jgi:hypothetical protein
MPEYNKKKNLFLIDSKDCICFENQSIRKIFSLVCSHNYIQEISYCFTVDCLVPGAIHPLFPSDVMGDLTPELVLLNVYGAPELIPRNEFRRPM